MAKYTLYQINEWREIAHKAGLHGAHLLFAYSAPQLQKIFNGIGADVFPEWLRRIISRLHPSLMPVALIHDVEWHERSIIKYPVDEKTDYEDFLASNARFRVNAETMAKRNYSWYNPMRYWVIWDGIKFAEACNTNLGYLFWKTTSAAIPEE